MFVPTRLQSERKGQTRKREADQINDCFTRSSLRERRRGLSLSEIAEGGMRDRESGKDVERVRREIKECRASL